METIKLYFVGRDSWSRPVYECNGKLYVDVDPRKNRRPEIYTKQHNNFDGEPCDPISSEYEFATARDTWY